MNKSKQNNSVYGLPLWFTTALTSNAVIIPGSNGANQTNSSPSHLSSLAPQFSYYDNIIGIGGGTGIYLGESSDRTVGYVLTADHLGSTTTIDVNGSRYNVQSGKQLGTSDLKLYTIGKDALGSLPSLPSVDYSSLGRTVDEDALMFGRGTRTQDTFNDPNNNDMVSQSGFDVYNWGPASSSISFGTNKVSNIPIYLGPGSTAEWTTPNGYQDTNFFLNFDDPGNGNYSSSWEGIASSGDSGGPVFIKELDGWKLAGITSYQMSKGTQPGSTSSFGNSTGVVDLSQHYSILPSLYPNTVPEPSSTLLLIIGTGTLLTYRNRTGSS